YGGRTPGARSECCRACHFRIRDRETTVDDDESLSELLLPDAEGRVREERIPSYERIQALLPEVPTKRTHLRRAGVEGRHGFPRLPIAYQLHDAEQTNGADRADR